ncbi:WcbI family polysaccharide biosynthesis putative acetyltransferase [Bosea sp. PAMC 26642]|uniref:WcbI family polysaccharide biosynthesis putative acetyltransferase n=1 Tax=Bosea sp. (strain PAMC 26642) TaxID=1792307 RepID=UPI00076FE17D|nr:WcbI family polysaccharide biosynthesis putative acetyltransferase [Bosea sp. PAMC 26642]AMJ61177.1 hypothetical protein AXW83_13510 [Bosea sp. PAMC 26642]
MKICILGNCQAQHMEMMLATARRDIEVVRLDPVFMMTAEHKDGVYAKLAEADFVFAQRISDEFKMDWLSSAEIKKSFGDKVTIWPNIYFDGYFPGVQYIYLGGWGKLLGPLGDYHFEQISAAHQRGATIAEAQEAFSEEPLFQKAPDPFGRSLGQLRARETDVDVPISDFIGDHLAAQRLFYTPNHPLNDLLGEMLRRLTERVGLEFEVDKAVAAPYRLDECYIPASPAIVRKFGLPFDGEPAYRGRTVLSIADHKVELGEIQVYSVEALTEAFYRVYDVVRGRA